MRMTLISTTFVIGTMILTTVFFLPLLGESDSEDEGEDSEEDERDETDEEEDSSIEKENSTQNTHVQHQNQKKSSEWLPRDQDNTRYVAVMSTATDTSEPSTSEDLHDTKNEAVNCNSETNRSLEQQIEEAKSRCRRNWAKKKLPKLESQAFELWTAAKDKPTILEYHKYKVEQYEYRLHTIQRTLEDASEEDIDWMTRAMETAAYDIETERWKMQVLAQAQPPKRIPATPRKGTLKRRRENRPTDEEDLTSGEEYDGDTSEQHAASPAPSTSSNLHRPVKRQKMSSMHQISVSNSTKFTKPLLAPEAPSPPEVIDLTAESSEDEDDIFDILDNMPERDDLSEMDANSAYIATPLLSCQKQGLKFMTEQKSESNELLNEIDVSTAASGAAGRCLWRTRMDNEDNVKFVNRAAGIIQDEHPRLSMGGLLADQMGLGKTLTVIALIASTIDAAESWCPNDQEETKDSIDLCKVRTTLVIAPPSVLQNWEEQLKKHTVRDSSSVLKYHGSNRLAKLYKLTDYDVILTTYGIIQSEMDWRAAKDKRKKSLFAHFNFYRVVLDEAHYIKSQASERARSIFKLHAERRWAITGTPIQNGLEDFGSILKFLRLTPFDKSYKELVTLSVKREPEIVLGRMNLVFNSIALRRTKERSTLPQNSMIVEKVVLRNDERYLYDRYTKEVSRKINNMATEDLSRNYVTFFAQLLSCRRICDSTDLLSKKELGLLSNSSDTSDDKIGDNSAQKLTEEQSYEQMDVLEGSLCCSRCDNELLQDTLDTDVDDIEICRYWDCRCFICPKCSENFEKEVEAIRKDDTFTCPVNNFMAKVKSVELTDQRFMQHKELIQQREQENTSEVALRYTKASSKTEALLKHLKDARQIGYTGGMPNKAVVFTFWSNYLDLLQIDLEKAGFRFLRLDGSVTQTKRVSLLEQFNNDPLITVLISTIGAGGVGINLQVANAVFIMEPQWNPAAEEQAVDRVHRMGQTRAVTTVRFITHDTVEQGVRKIAQQKQALADFTTTTAKIQRSDVAAKLQELLGVLQRRWK